jgi:hypothetical protein
MSGVQGAQDDDRRDDQHTGTRAALDGARRPASGLRLRLMRPSAPAIREHDRGTRMLIEKYA